MAIMCLHWADIF